MLKKEIIDKKNEYVYIYYIHQYSQKANNNGSC